MNYPLTPHLFFPDALVAETYQFIKTLSPKQIELFRNSYTREMNKSSDDNELPPHTMEKRRCFLYLTSRT